MASAYSPQQVSQFLEYIQVPNRLQLQNNPPRDLAFLTTLHTHMLSTVPYENLPIHYSPNHKIDLDPQVLFDKIVTSNRGRGGYCLENGIFYNHILRVLGFRAYLVGARMRSRVDGVPQGPYSGWVHVVNIVTLHDDTRWMVDVGFGGDGPTKPLPLIEDCVSWNLFTQEVRLSREFLPGQTERTPEKRFWVYQYRNKSDHPWNSFYAFSDVVEFLPGDCNVINWFTGSYPENLQTFTMLIVKFLLRATSAREDENEIYGKRMLVDGLVKDNLDGRTKIIDRCETEADRIRALKKWFNIDLTTEEIDGIKGWRTELRGE